MRPDARGARGDGSLRGDSLGAGRIGQGRRGTLARPAPAPDGRITSSRRASCPGAETRYIADARRRVDPTDRPGRDEAERGEGNTGAEGDVERTGKVDAFVRRHFTWPGTLRLHRAALGPDILRAPVNVLLSLVLVLTRVSAWLCARLGLRRTADWLRRRRLLLRTSVAAKVEAAILSELLDVPLPETAASLDRAALSRAILAAPQFREAIRTRGTLSEAQALADRIMDALAEYTGTRSAMAEITTALIALAVGGLAFQALTPGMISMAPGVAEAVSRTTAIADFPLGSTLGGLWYGVFPVGPSPVLIGATIVALVLLGSVVAAFAGTIADPVQVRTGMHRRRLMRLVATLEAEVHGASATPFVAREHFFVRILDLWDAGLSLLRAFRS